MSRPGESLRDRGAAHPAEASGTAGGAADGPPAYSRGYTRWVLFLLLALYGVNFLDRQVINILGQSIKTALGLSDLELGLLTGTAFGIFYSVLGLPIARLADRRSRVKIITASLTLWSLLTAASGLALSYLQLFLIRLGVGVGEAGGTPPAQSLISDYFPEDRRSTAMAVFNLGVPIGSFCGFLFGGFMNDTLGWRWAFILAGLPGLLLALAIRLTMREPPRGHADHPRSEVAGAEVPLRQSLRGLLERRSFIRLVLGGTFGIFIVYVTNTWLPPLFIRLHGLTAEQFGLWIALAIGPGGAIGALGGGYLADRLKARYPRAEIWLLVTSTALTCPLMLATVLVRSTTGALLCMFIMYMVAYVWMGPTCAMVQRVAPVRSRALATGIQLFVANVTALAFGPPLVGLASDLLAPSAGVQSLRYALAGASLFALGGTAVYASAGRYLPKDLEREPSSDLEAVLEA